MARCFMLGLVFSLAVGGCGSGSEEMDSNGLAPVSTVPFGGGEEFQDALLADGVVTEAELERAIRTYLACVVDSGIEVFGPVWESKRRRMLYGVQVGFDTAKQDRNMECFDEFAVRVDQTYQLAHNFDWPGMEEDVESFRLCLVAAGFEEFEQSMGPEELKAMVARIGFSRFGVDTDGKELAEFYEAPGGCPNPFVDQYPPGWPPWP